MVDHLHTPKQKYLIKLSIAQLEERGIVIGDPYRLTPAEAKCSNHFRESFLLRERGRKDCWSSSDSTFLISLPSLLLLVLFFSFGHLVGNERQKRTPFNLLSKF